MKKLRQIVELKKIDLVPDPDLQGGDVSDFANPKSDAERAFVDKHVVQQSLHPAFKTSAEQDAVFKASNIKKDKTKNAGYHDGMDAEVYEQAIQFVKDNLTETNLAKFETLLEEDRESAIKFALDVATEIVDDE